MVTLELRQIAVPLGQSLLLRDVSWVECVYPLRQNTKR